MTEFRRLYQSLCACVCVCVCVCVCAVCVGHICEKGFMDVASASPPLPLSVFLIPPVSAGVGPVGSGRVSRRDTGGWGGEARWTRCTTTRRTSALAVWKASWSWTWNQRALKSHPGASEDVKALVCDSSKTWMISVWNPQILTHFQIILSENRTKINLLGYSS